MKSRFVFLVTLIFLVACNNNREGIDQPPPLFTTPKTVELNSIDGYTQNTVTGNNISPIINSNGDTILTGVPIPVNGHYISPDSISEPVKREAKKPLIEYNTLKTTTVSSNISIIEINRDSLIRLGVKDNIECETCVSEVGEIIPTGVTLPVQGKVVSCIQPEPIIAGSPEYKHSASFNIQLLGIDQGLEGAYVRSIVEDSRGNIWIGSYYGGVSKYDGNTFVTYGEEEGLSNGVYAIIEDRQGNMWFATNDKGVCMYDGKSFTFYSEKEGLSSNSLYSMFEDSKGNIWVGGSKGVSKLGFDDLTKDISRTITNYTEKEGFIDRQVRGIVEDKEGNMWFGSRGGGVCKMNVSTDSNEHNPIVFTHYQTKDGLADNYINSMHVDMRGDIWFATADGLTKLSTEGNGGNRKEFFTSYFEKDGLGGENVFEIVEEESGDLWFGSYGGGATRLSRSMVDDVEIETFTVYTEDEGLSTNETGPHLVDKGGNIWFMAWGEGVSVIRNRPFRNYTIKDGLPYDRVYQVVEDDSGAIWVGTDGGGARKLVLSRNQDAEVVASHSYPTEEYNLYNGSHYSMLNDRTGNIWFGDITTCVLAPGYSFDKKDKERIEYVTSYSSEEGLAWSRVRALMEDHSGNVWVGSGKGLRKLILVGEEKGRVVEYLDDGSTYYTSSLLEDSSGNIWIGTDFGLLKLSKEEKVEFTKETLTNYSEREGLCNNIVNVLLQDRHGNIWVGTNDGLDVLHNSKGGSSNQLQITHYTQKEGLSHNTIYSITEDNNGHIWVGTKSGLNELVFSNGYEGSYIPKFIRQYGKFDGLKGVNFIRKSALLDSENRLWWGSTKSLNMLDMGRFTTSQDPPSVHLNNLYINEQYIDFHNLEQTDSIGFSFSRAMPFYNCPLDLVLDHNKNHLTFHFSAVDWGAPHKISYSYLMEGHDAKWSQPNEETKVDYRNLPYGKYTFKVRAIGESGEWSEAYEYEFTISPPWWHTWWARILYVLSGSLLLFLIIRWRTVKLEQRQKELETEVEEATQEIREQKEKAEQSEAFKQQFLANMSHEIRTPMNAVMGMTNLVLDTELKEKQKFYLERVKKSSENLLHIINDILDLSKIEAGKMGLEEIDFSISQMVDQVKQTLHHKAEEKGLELVVTIKGGVNDIVVGDPIRLNQVLINLAGNAIKFTEKGSVNIVVSAHQQGVQFSIIDTGIGIPEDKLQTVFENFSQANASDTRKYGGTGLGLSISRQLVELMGSGISIESKEGSGSTFSFVVDFKEGSIEKLEERTALERNVDGSVLDGLKILVTDDNEYNRIVAKDTLMSRANLEVYEAENGKEAVEMVVEMDFDAILMDVQMPVMNGYDATRAIRNLEGSKKDTPIIALTASVLRVDLDKCTDAGMNSYIPKPFKPHELISGIAQVLNIEVKVVVGPKPIAVKRNPGKSKTTVSEVTNLNYLNEFCEGDVQKMKKYIGIYIKSAPVLIGILKDGIVAKDFETIANQVHGFKTKFIMMGMTKTKDLAIELERLCREEPNSEQIHEILEDLLTDIEVAIKELSTY